jgi:hypothetical protein
MHRFAIAVSLSLLASGPAFAAAPEFPLRADAPPRFVPAGWRVESRIEADFDKDGRNDIAMIVRNDEQRYLLVAVGEGKGLRRVGLGELDAYPQGDATLSAPKGVLVVEDLTGGSSAFASTYRYRYEAASGRMRLIGDDVEFYSRTNAHGSVKVSSNRLTGKRTRQTSTPDDQGEYSFSREVTEQIGVSKIYLEDAPDPEDTIGFGE